MTSSPSVQLSPDLGFISFGFNSGAPVDGREEQPSEREPREGKEEKIGGTGRSAQWIKVFALQV